LFAAPYGNFVLYHSTNGGALWRTNLTSLADLLCVSTSADGTLVLSADNNGHVQVSTNSGLKWQPYTTIGGIIYSVNISGAGRRLTAVSGNIFSSTNQGLLWFTNRVPPNGSWLAAASSADGARLVVVGQNGPVYTSMDSGATWVSNSAPSLSWQAAASSADGNAMFAAASNGSIWVRRTNAPPALTISNSPSGLVLSWLIPSSGGVLQQNQNLTSTNWVDLTNAPAVDLSTLHRQVILPAAGSSAFYRLRAL
jgi:hypothetical protein